MPNHDFVHGLWTRLLVLIDNLLSAGKKFEAKLVIESSRVHMNNKYVCIINDYIIINLLDLYY